MIVLINGMTGTVVTGVFDTVTHKFNLIGEMTKKMMDWKKVSSRFINLGHDLLRCVDIERRFFELKFEVKKGN